MDELTQKIADLEAELATVRGNEELSAIDRSREVLRITGEIKATKAELVEVKAADEALEELEADKAAEEAAGDKEDEGDKAGEGDAKPNPKPVNEEAPVALAAAASDTDVKPDETEAKPAFSLTAAASIGNVAAGGELSREDVLEQLQYSARSTSGKNRMFEMNRFEKGTKSLNASNSAIENSRIMREARQKDQRPLNLTAAACFCSPDEIKADFDAIGRLGRPVADVFASGAIGTAGFTFYPDIAINPDSGSVNLWDCTDQANVDPNDENTWKQCSELDCFTPQDALGYMITACTFVQRTHQWAHPEQVNTWLDKLRIEYDRLAETALLNIIDDAGGTPLTVGAAGGMMEQHGVKSQIEYALANLSFSLGYQFRADGLAGHTAIIERGLIDAMVADEHIRGFDRGAARAEIVRSVFEDYGVRLVERMDEANRDGLPAAAAATVAALNAGGAIDAAGVEPTKTPLRMPFSRMYVLRPDQWFHAEGTMVAADWHVDPELLRQNKMMYFYENVELLVQTGLEKPHIVDIYGPINGGRSDLVTPPS